jgi:lysophospholipase L1-like esterase
VPQFGHLTGDITITTYEDQASGTTNLFAVTDEASPNDADYIESGPDPDDDDIYEGQFETLIDPDTLVDHVLRVRMAKVGASPMGAYVSLRQGAGTEIARWNVSGITTTPTTQALSLNADQITSITTWNDLRVRIKPTRLPVPQNNLVVGLGDSITVASHNTAGAGITKDYQFQPRLINTSGLVGGYLTWAAILPVTGQSVGDGRFRFNGTHATSGIRSDQILADHVNGTDSPLNDNPKPGIVSVMAGANDMALISNNNNTVNTTELDFTIAQLNAMYTALINADILPIACGVPPTNNANYQLACIALNDAIETNAAARGLQFVDVFEAARAVPGSTTNAQWATNHNTADGIHPSLLGAKAIGQVVRDAVDKFLPYSYPNLVTAATDGDADLIFKNGAFERDANTDNMPDGGGTENSGYWTFTANGAASSLGARTNYSGQAWRVNKTVDTAGNSQMQGSGSGTVDIDLVDGHAYDVGFVTEIASMSGTTTQYQITMVKVSDGTKVPFRLTLSNDATFSSAIAPFKFLRTFRCSDSASGTPITSGGYRFLITWGHQTGTPTDNLLDTYMGQLTVRDLGVMA